MSADTDSMELVELEQAELYEEDAEVIGRRRRLMSRVVAVGVMVAGLVVVLAILPLAGIDYPHSRAVVPSLVGPSDTVLSAFGLTPVLVAVAALTVVALLRKLPYGIGAVITLTIGASLTTAAVRGWADGWVPASGLPNGNLTAALALVCATTLVASPKFMPMVGGSALSALRPCALPPWWEARRRSSASSPRCSS